MDAGLARGRRASRAGFSSAPFLLEGKKKKGETVQPQFHPKLSYQPYLYHFARNIFGSVSFSLTAFTRHVDSKPTDSLSAPLMF